MTTTRPRFKSIWLPTLAVTLAGWGVYRAGASATHAAPPPPPAVIALVNMESLMKGLNEVKSRNTDLIAVQEKRNKELQDYEKRLDTIKKELDILKRDGEEWRAKTQEGILLQAEGQTKKKIFEQLNDLDEGASISAVYLKAQAAIAKVAAKDGYSLVMLDDRPLAVPKSGSGKEMIGLMMSKRILYGADNLDITDRVITEMNNEFSAPAPRGQK